MPSPYPILETLLSQGYAVEFSMGNDRWFYLAASHPAKYTIEAAGKTIADAVIMLDSRLKDREAVEHTLAHGQANTEREVGVRIKNIGGGSFRLMDDPPAGKA